MNLTFLPDALSIPLVPFIIFLASGSTFSCSQSASPDQQLRACYRTAFS